MNVLKELLMTRGAQVIAKLVSKGFAMASGYFGFEYASGQVESGSMAVATAVAAALFFGIDLAYHKITGKEKEDAKK